MGEQKLSARDKTVQKMTKDGLVEKNLANDSTVKVSSRTSDVKLSAKGQRESGKSADISFVKSRDAPDEKGSKRRGKLHMDEEKPDFGSRLSEKERHLTESRGDTRSEVTGGTKRPQNKKRLQFQADEVGIKDQEAVSIAKKDKKTAAKKHSARERFYEGDVVTEGVTGKGKSKLQHGEIGKKAKDAVAATTVAARKKAVRDSDGNAAVESVDTATDTGLIGKKLSESSARANKRRKNRKSVRLEKKADREKIKGLYEDAVKKDEKLQNGSALKKMIQKQRIKREYAKAKRMEQAVGAPVGTVEYIKKIGAKVTNFFVENRKAYISIGVFIALIFLIMTSFTSCSSMFFQNLVTYVGTSYISSDEAIRDADKYYSEKEVDLQEKVNQMETEETGYDVYNYNIDPIGHDPFVLISYLSAKYEEFTFNDEIKRELDDLFDQQYKLTKESIDANTTVTKTVRVGESLGNVVTSGYCNCSACCGQWAGGPTASGAYPTANHTIAVDAATPFVPMGTKVVMNGVEYTVEDTGAFARYGVQFDVYYDSHAAASAHGHKTWEAFIADDNGSREVEVKVTETQKVLNITLTNNDLSSLCQSRLNAFQKELFSAYGETKGGLQMFYKPVDYNWYTGISSYFGYRIHPIAGVKRMHEGIDVTVPEGTEVFAGLDGTVVKSTYNDGRGNYVDIKNDLGYTIRYQHLKTRKVSVGQTVTRGDVIGLSGNTGASTGAHLHFELFKDGELLNPLFYFEIGEEELSFGGNEYTSAKAAALIEEAKRHLGTPYVWGGYSPSGFDCSGFVSYCLTKSGAMNTGHLTCDGLIARCRRIGMNELQPGDLVFFQGTYNASPPTHVGIYLGNGQFIHCGSPCKISNLSDSYWQQHWYSGGRW